MSSYPTYTCTLVKVHGLVRVWDLSVAEKRITASGSLKQRVPSSLFAGRTVLSATGRGPRSGMVLAEACQKYLQLPSLETIKHLQNDSIKDFFMQDASMHQRRVGVPKNPHCPTTLSID